MRTKAILNTCSDAERLYTTLVKWYGDLDTSDDSERMIQRLRIVYNDTLKDLRDAGIGGVLINGVFRDINY